MKVDDNMKKIMIIALMMFPMLTFGLTCDTIKDSQNTNDRAIACDVEKSTSTTYKTNSDVKVLDNSVCTVTCSEEVVYMIDPVQKVLSGTSFSYPLYISGERKCKAEYKYSAYEAKIRNLVNEYESLSGSAKTTKKNEIVNYYAEKKSCDNFKEEGTEEFNKYGYDAEVTLTVQTSTSDVVLNYEFEDISEYYSNVEEEEINYAACSFNETSIKCNESDTTIESWEEIARIFGKYTMQDVYLEKYTGEVKTVSDINTCNAKDRYFVSMDEITNLDPGYNLKLVAKKLGDNLLERNRNNWSLTVNCKYEVKNLMFPQQSSTGSCIDEKCEEYGTTAFMYRIVDLNDPFPNRNPGANWVGKESIITSTKDNITSMQKFVITLNRSSINRIRTYNDTHTYDTFTIDDPNTNVITAKTFGNGVIVRK